MKLITIVIAYLFIAGIILVGITAGEFKQKTTTIGKLYVLSDIQENVIDNQETTIDVQKKSLSMYNKSTNLMKTEVDNLNKREVDYKNIIVHKDFLIERQDRIILRPTLQQVLDFLEEDDTDKSIWTKENDCTQIANSLVRNAIEQQIYACIVDIDFVRDRGHNVVAFNTADFGIMYFEPITDDNIYMYIGMDYGGYLGYDDVHLIVRQYDSCFERVI